MEMLDNLKSMPKGLLIVLSVSLLSLAAYGIYLLSGSEESAEKEAATANAIVEFPDGKEDQSKHTKIAELKNSQHIGSRSNAVDYWESLQKENEGGEGGLKVSDNDSQDSPLMPGKEGVSKKDDVSLDSSEYSELERYYIQKGIKTKEEIDREHQELKEMEERGRKSREDYARSLQQNSDSAVLARMNKAFELAQKYTAQKKDSTEKPAPKEPQQQERKIDLNAKPTAITTRTIKNDDIITSLEDDVTSGSSSVVNGQTTINPVKATFLKSETVVTGQRVIIRLLQDLRLSDGTLIPVNTHIMGMCEISSRLKIQISTINWGGRIYYARLDAFDQDGVEGIYCPAVALDKKESALKRIGKKVGETASNLFGVVASNANPYIANLTRETSGEIVQSIDGNGNISVTVASGYEFYIFENLGDKK